MRCVSAACALAAVVAAATASGRSTESVVEDWVRSIPDEGQPRGVGVRIGTDDAVYLQGLGQMATARYADGVVR